MLARYAGLVIRIKILLRNVRDGATSTPVATYR